MHPKQQIKGENAIMSKMSITTQIFMHYSSIYRPRTTSSGIVAGGFRVASKTMP